MSEPSDLKQDLAKHSLSSPIFVVGCGHSGTTLMVRLLGLHRKIYAIPFETYMFRFPQKASSRFEQRWPALWTEQKTLGWIPHYVDRLNSDTTTLTAIRVCHTAALQSNKPRWAEKTPKQIYDIKTILEIIPMAQILLMIRDGRDVAISLRNRYRQLDSFASAVTRWINDNLAGEAYWDHPKVMVVRLEDVIAQPTSTIEKICHFLGENYDAHIEMYNRDERGTSFNWREEASLGDWRSYRRWLGAQPIIDTRGKWIEEMSITEKVIFKTQAGNMLIRYGYASNLEW